jgi:acetyl esterase
VETTALPALDLILHHRKHRELPTTKAFAALHTRSGRLSISVSCFPGRQPMNGSLDGGGALSPEMLTLLQRVADETGAPPDPTLLTPADGRSQVERANARWNVDLPPMNGVADIWVPANCSLGSSECRMKVLVPRNAVAGAILFVHGGGFAFCSPETHERCARVLATETSLPVLLPDYRLAPEHPFPAGLLDTVACMRAAFSLAAAEGVSSGPLVVAGDSAGANLALAAMLHEQEQGRPLPTAGLLFYGSFGCDFETPSYVRFAEGPGLTKARMQRYWAWYCGGRDLRANPLAAPLAACAAALAALPPLYLMAAAVDPLLSDTLILQRRLKALGRTEEATVVPGVTHGFLQNTNELNSARMALAAAGKAARETIGSAK